MVRAGAVVGGLACHRTPAPVSLRVATFNVSMFREGAGELQADLATGVDPQAQKLATLLQTVRPDIILLNEFDWDPDGLAARALIDRYLAVAQRPDLLPLDYPHLFAGPVNTGVPSGVDLDGDGYRDHPPGSREYGSDCFGFGLYPGQYGMLLLSRYPIDAARTFQHLRWVDLPEARLPDNPATPEPGDWYSPEALKVMRLSSKSHWDVTVRVGHGLHVLAAHPTPPVFDGREDRNGRRNGDEIRLWTEHLNGSAAIVDDEGRAGGLGEGSFVVLGDLNNDPYDGDGHHEAVRALLEHPRVLQVPAPTGPGGIEQAIARGGSNPRHLGPPATDTIDLFDRPVGNLRLDYVLPSADLQAGGSGVFWPRTTDPDFALVGPAPWPISDHRLVWRDLLVPR